MDDTVITRLGPEAFYIVTNAACREKDMAYLSKHIKDYTAEEGHDDSEARINWEVLDGWGLIALQGPLSSSILEPLIMEPDVDLKRIPFGQSRFLTLCISSSSSPTTFPPVLVSRGGYTGEDGFEISTPPELTQPITQSLLGSAGPDKLRLAGLGARDSLRLEAGMCLYGHDLDDSTTPVEASLGWIVGRDRQPDVSAGSTSFLGADVILKQLQSGEIPRKRIGLIMTDDRAPAAREGASIVSIPPTNNNNDNNDSINPDEPPIIGKVTSGSPSPTLGKNIAMGYITSPDHRKQGSQVGIVVRGKVRRAEVVRMPFIKLNYWRGRGWGLKNPQ